jgi:DNA-binding response OmpR family regulator
MRGVKGAGRGAPCADDAPIVPHSPGGRAASRGRVLVVEDDPFTSALISEELREHGYDVVGPAGHLDEAVRLARGEAIDAALVDLNLHGVLVNDVLDVLARRRIPFAFMTGHSTVPEDVGHAAPIVEKPFTKRQLLAALEALRIDRSEAAAPSRQDK